MSEIIEMMDSYESGLISESEAASGVVQEISLAPSLTTADLQQISNLLPDNIKQRAFGILRKVQEANYVFPITTVGGKGLMGDPLNLQMAYQTLITL